MIRLTYYLRRKAGYTLEAFQSYWRDRHGPLVASVSSDLNVFRYVQVHTLEDPINDAMNKARGGKMEPVYDGVAELWWENEQVLNAAIESKQGAAGMEALLADEKNFIDLPRSPLYMAYEYPQINPTPENIVATPKSNILKLHFPLRHIKSMDEAVVRRHWLTNHGPIIRANAAASGLLRYIQVHRANSPLDEDLREARGTIVEPYLGHAEVWFSRNQIGTPEGAAAGRAAVADESKFIDFERSAMWVGKELVFVDRR